MPNLNFQDLARDISSSNWIEIGEAAVAAATITIKYHLALFEFIYAKKDYEDSTIFGDDLWAKVQVFSLSLIFKLWSLKHYRSKSFQQDMLDNLKNVAIPGTGIPLSLFCYSYWTCLFFVVILNPMICFAGAVNKARQQATKLEDLLKLTFTYYIAHLVHPDDWFSFWRLNCRLVSYHSYTTQSTDYLQEDKWTFLTSGKDLNVPVSPFMDNIESLVCKNKNIEGGMGIHFFKNAAYGGDWIIQERLKNADWLNELLPNNAPLSTMRVITTSSWSLSEEFSVRKNDTLVKSVSSAVLFDLDAMYDEGGSQRNNHISNGNLASNSNGSGNSNGLVNGHGSGMSGKRRRSRSSNAGDESCHSLMLSVDSRETTSPSVKGSPVHAMQCTEEELLAASRKYIRAESGVLRLGRENAETDHSCMLFDVDLITGVVKGGTTNAHWYQLGLNKAKDCPWLPAISGAVTHPDFPNPVVAGRVVPDLQAALDIVTTSHYKMMPDVPIVGWDVAFTSKGVFLLEVNLSCNFFRGSFDIPRYIELVDRYWVHLEKIEKLNQNDSGKKKYKRS